MSCKNRLAVVACYVLVQDIRPLLQVHVIGWNRFYLACYLADEGCRLGLRVSIACGVLPAGIVIKTGKNDNQAYKYFPRLSVAVLLL